MSQWKDIGAVVALSITAALAGTGCIAQGEDDDGLSDEIADVGNDGAQADQNEATGEAQQGSWFGNFIGCGFPFAGAGGFGSCGVGFPCCGGGFPFGGFGWGSGFGGCGPCGCCGGIGGFGGGFGGGCGGC